MLLLNENQRRILFAEDGIDSWNSAHVANAILRRIRKADTITVDESDVMVVHRMAEVLHVSQTYDDPGFKIGFYLPKLEVPTKDILAVFEKEKQL